MLQKRTRNREITSEDGFLDDSAVIIAREELLGLIQAAVQHLKNLDTPDSSLERKCAVESSELFRQSWSVHIECATYFIFQA